MTSLLDDAFEHHVWATQRLLGTCAELTTEQLATSVTGVYGSILDTLRHIVGADAWYLYVMTNHAVARIDESTMDIAELHQVMGQHAAAWSDLLSGDLDPAKVITVRHADGSETAAPLGVRLAQALHHGSDHRSQIATALTAIGVESPEIDVWAFGQQDGRVS